MQVAASQVIRLGAFDRKILVQSGGTILPAIIILNLCTAVFCFRLGERCKMQDNR